MIKKYSFSFSTYQNFSVNEERVETLLGKPIFTFEGENYFLNVRNYQGDLAPSEKKDCRLSRSTELREISIRYDKLLYYLINKPNAYNPYELLFLFEF